MPEIYGTEHVFYLTVVFSLMVLAFGILRKRVKTEKGLERTIRILGGILLASIVWNRLSIAILRDGWDSLLPGSFCGLTSLALSVSALIFRKNSPVFHCLAYCGILGGLVTLAYPDFIGQAPTIWYPMTISGLWHHTLMLFLGAFLLASGYVRPELRKWHYLPIGLSFYICVGLFEITQLGYSDAMEIFNPILSGTPLNWFVLGCLFLPVHALFLFVWGVAAKRRWIRLPVLREA